MLRPNAQKQKGEPSVWEMVEKYTESPMSTERMKVPGGWIVRSDSHNGVAQTFVSDPGHMWNLDDSVVK